MGYFEKIGWSPSIGDPTILGWLTVAAYLYTAIICFKASRNVDQVVITSDERLKKLWYTIGVIFICLSINKQLDIQSFFTQALKHMALQQGWYEDRRELQRYFIYSIFTIGSLTLMLLLNTYSQYVRSHILVLVGLTFVIAFILVRAASFHDVDAMLYSRHSTSAFKLNHLLELSGIALVAINAHVMSKNRRNKRHLKRRLQQIR